MANITIYNGSNSQVVTINGLVDTNGVVVSGASINGRLVRAGVTLTGSELTFVESATPGNYTAPLNGFDASRGSAQLHIDGSVGAFVLSFIIPITISVRTS